MTYYNFLDFVSIFINVTPISKHRNLLLGSQMVVTYLSEESERAHVLSRLGFSYGIGMLVGPTLGGYLTSNFSEQTASLVAAFGSLVSVILVLIFIPYIPKNVTNEKKRIIDHTKGKDENESKNQGFFQNIAVIGKLFFLPGVGILLIVKLVGGIPIGILQSMFSCKYILYFLCPFGPVSHQHLALRK